MKNYIYNIFFVLLVLATMVSCKKEPVTSVNLDKKVLNLVVGKSETLKETIIPANASNQAVKWESNSIEVATVDNGIVRALSVGKAIITLTTLDGNFTAKCCVSVFQPIEPEMIFVEGGTFTMGCTDGECKDDGREEPAHQVTLSNFYIAKFEVTQKEWNTIMVTNPSSFVGDNLPIHNINREETEFFIFSLNALTGKNYRFPTEAEWEYAARGGNQSKGYKYSGSDNIDEVAWCEENSLNIIRTVGMKKPNELGIYDMSGNVAELCSDRYGPYTDESQINPTGPTEGVFKIYRGGSIAHPKYPTCRVSARSFRLYDPPCPSCGLRLVLSQ